MRRAFIISALMLSATTLAQADVSTDLEGFMNNVGYASNITNPQAFQSQASGFYGGGSLYARTPVRDYQLITLDLPNWRAGCAGIDLYAGSLSYLSNEKLVQLGKSVMTNSGAYAVDVMLASTVPQLKQVRDYLQAMVQKVNQMSVNSCEMSQNLVGGVFPKTAASQQKICNDQRRFGQQGAGHDYVSSRMACAGDEFKPMMENAAKNPEHAKSVVLGKNMVWSLLQERGLVAKDKELSEMVMSLTGTLIIDKDGHITNVPAFGVNHGLIQALIGGVNTAGHQADMWRCDEEKDCLTVTKTSLMIPEAKSLSGQVRRIIREMNQKVISDTAFDQKDINFLSLTSLPVMRFLVVLNSTQYGDAAIDIEEYSTLVAQDMMQHYLSELFEMVGHAVQGSAFNEELLKDIQVRIDSASSKIAAIDPMVSRKLEEKLAMINNMVRVERQLAASLHV